MTRHLPALLQLRCSFIQALGLAGLQEECSRDDAMPPDNSQNARHPSPQDARPVIVPITRQQARYNSRLPSICRTSKI